MKATNSSLRGSFLGFTVAVLLFSGSFHWAGANVFAADVELPLSRAVLFKNGIGFFEYQGEVSGSVTIGIPITASQLDDVLKSLTVIDLDGGKVGSISYGSSAPLERQLQELETGDLRGRDLASILGSLVGTRLEAEAPGGNVTGRLFNAELRIKPGAGNALNQPVQVIELALYTDEGKLVILELQSLEGLRFSSESTREDLERYLEVVEGARNDNIRNLVISADGTGERRIRLSYTSEVPVWKATYRLIMDEGRPAFLQGWAIVDNTTSSDWDRIDLSLVSSSPVSFIYRLSEPLYSERPEVPVSAGPQLAPELHQGAIEIQEDQAISRMEMPASREKMMMSSARMAAGSAPPAPMAEMIRESTAGGAEAGTVGDQFEYRITSPVSLRKNQSALIPLLQEEIDAEKVSVFTSGKSGSHPRNAVWLSNGTGLTLDGGPFSITDSGLFAGEGLFETIYPGEKRLLSYALDRAVTIEEDSAGSGRSFQSLTRDRGVLVISHKLMERKVYRIRNNAEAERQIVIEHPLRQGWDLALPASSEEKTADYYRFKARVAGNESSEFEVREEKTVSRRIALDSITENEIRLWVSGAEMDQETRDKLDPLVALTREMAETRQQIDRLEAERERIYNSQERLRENLSALGTSPAEAGLRQRYVSQLEEQENRLAVLEKELAGHFSELERLQGEIADEVASLDF